MNGNSAPVAVTASVVVDSARLGRLDTGFGRVDETLPYHAPCQLRSHGIGLPAMELFALVPGLTDVDLDHDCCGIAGTYGGAALSRFLPGPAQLALFAVVMLLAAVMMARPRPAPPDDLPRHAAWKIVLEGLAHTLRENEDVRRAYLGEGA